MGVVRKLLISISDALRPRGGGGQPSQTCPAQTCDWACPVSRIVSAPSAGACTTTATGISLLQLWSWHTIITSSGREKALCKLAEYQVVNIKSNNTLPNSGYDVGPGTVTFHTCVLTLCSFIFPYPNKTAGTFPALRLLRGCSGGNGVSRRGKGRSRGGGGSAAERTAGMGSSGNSRAGTSQ